MKVYTKTGDKGYTALIGGTRVPKSHPRVEAYGMVDELISCIGMVRACEITAEVQKELHGIQSRLMVCAAILAADEQSVKTLPVITMEDVVLLEKAIDEMGVALPSMRHFVLSAAPLSAASCHMARSVCRRTERVCTTFALEYSLPGVILVYMNRLSDYLFVLARRLTIESGHPEEFWIPE